MESIRQLARPRPILGPVNPQTHPRPAHFPQKWALVLQDHPCFAVLILALAGEKAQLRMTVDG